ncbi:MAG: DNA adenine methylase [Candidatus Paceibacterota bacterium]
MAEALRPLFMWAGGKSRLIKHYEPVWPVFAGGSYVEPFFGGGAIFGWLHGKGQADKSVINDINTELVGLLIEIRDRPEEFIKDVSSAARRYLKIEGKELRKEWFYRARKSYWSSPTPSKLYLLMRTAFNGIWQTCEGSNGLFGTPAGLLNHSRVEQIIDKDLVRAWSKALKGAKIVSKSYELVNIPKKPSLIYLDPPYRDSFTDYSTGFSDDDQRALAEWYRVMVDKGHKVILANRCVDGDRFFEDLLEDIGDFHYFDVTYTAGRRKSTADGFEAKPAREFIVISRDKV